jgi:hypothetical protein
MATDEVTPSAVALVMWPHNSDSKGSMRVDNGCNSNISAKLGIGLKTTVSVATYHHFS